MTANNSRFNKKVALVTGASKGIGAEIAKQLAREGAAVIVNYASSKKDADSVVAQIEKNCGRAVAIQADVSKEGDIQKLFKEAHAAFGQLDVLVNNAGIYHFAALEEITTEHFHKQFDLNVLGLLLSTREAVKYFGSKGGSVVNVSSIVSKIAMPETAVYSATKAAVDAITRCLASELGPRGIRVNAINPGMVETEGTHTLGIIEGEMKDGVVAQTPLGRIGKVDDIAPAVLYFASDDAKWVTGETLYIAGGYR